MGYELKGKVIKVYETKQVSDKFSKRELVVETADNPKYPQPIIMVATGDRIGQLDSVGLGDEVKVEFSVRGRAWQDKFFTELNIWKVEVTAKNATPEPTHGGGSAQDDIPFAKVR